MPAQHLDVRHGTEPSCDVADAPRRQHQGVATGQDHLPDARVTGDVGERGIEGVARQCVRAARADRLAAEAEAAVHRAHVGELEQHAVRVAMDDAERTGEALVADRVGQLLGAVLRLAGIGHDLARDRIVRIAAVDEPGHGRRDGDGVTRCNGLQGVHVGGRYEACGPKFRYRFQGPLHGRTYCRECPWCHLGCGMAASIRMAGGRWRGRC